MSMMVLLWVTCCVLACCGRVSTPRPHENVRTAYSALSSPVALDFDARGNILYTSIYSCYVGIIRRTDGVSSVLAGLSGSCGFADGTLSNARFNYPVGVALHRALNVIFVSDEYNHRIRMVNVSSSRVTTAAGSTAGFIDGVGPAAKLNLPVYVMLYALGSAGGGALYIADYQNGAVRKYDVVTSAVTTVAVGALLVAGLIGTRDGRVLYAACDTQKILRIDVSSNVVSILAGSGTRGFQDAVGTKAMFNTPRGLALNNDETMLIIAEWNNYRVRRLNLVTLLVTTVAGNGNSGSVDGPPLSASFVTPAGLWWTCTFLSRSCGVFVADVANVGTLRYVPVEGLTQSSSFTPVLSVTSSDTCVGTSATSSQSEWLTASASSPVSASPPAPETWSSSQSEWSTASASPPASVTRSSTNSNSLTLLSVTAKSTDTATTLLSGTQGELSSSTSLVSSVTVLPSLTDTMLRCTRSLSVSATTTQSRRTNTDSHTLWQCNRDAPRTIATGLTSINSSLLLTQRNTHVRQSVANTRNHYSCWIAVAATCRPCSRRPRVNYHGTRTISTETFGSPHIDP